MQAHGFPEVLVWIAIKFVRYAASSLQHGFFIYFLSLLGNILCLTWDELSYL